MEGLTVLPCPLIKGVSVLMVLIKHWESNMPASRLTSESCMQVVKSKAFLWEGVW